AMSSYSRPFFLSRTIARRVRWSSAMPREDHVRRSSASGFRGIVVLTSDAQLQMSAALVPGGHLANATILRLLPFGNARRDQLVDRWLQAQPEQPHKSTAAYARAKQARLTTLTNVVGKNLVPAFPVVLISLLTASDHNKQLSTNKSSFSYYYDLLIRQQLTHGRNSQQEINVKFNLLSFIAYALQDRSPPSASESELREIVRQFEQARMLELNYADILADFEQSKVLVREEHKYQFKDEWARFYFTARQLADLLQKKSGQQEARLRIEALLEKLHTDDGSNILLFLAYFSKDEFLFDSARALADGMYRENSEATISYDKSLSHTPDLQEMLDNLVEEKALEADHDEAVENDQKAAELNSELRRIQEISREFFTSVRATQLLGQLLKNNPAGIEGDEKLRIARSMYGLSLRTLSELQRLTDSTKEALLAAFVEPMLEQGRTPSLEKLKKHALESFHFFRLLAANAAVRRVAWGLSDPSLVPLADRLADEVDTDASRLIAVGVKLNLLSPDFPTQPVLNAAEQVQDNPLGKTILQRLVATRLYLYDTARQEKDRICAKLEINPKRIPRTSR
ncbi:MAG: hypothetical protein ACOZQL_38930, partial [Myxococcota bacterium]